MVLVFLDSKGPIYTNYVPIGKSVNGKYIVEVMKTFLKHLRKRGQHWLREGGCSTGTIKMICHAPYSPDLAILNFFFFPKVKSGLAGTTLTRNTFKKEWEGVVRTLKEDDYTTAFMRRYERCKKCVEIGGDYVEKS